MRILLPLASFLAWDHLSSKILVSARVTNKDNPKCNPDYCPYTISDAVDLNAGSLATVSNDTELALINFFNQWLNGDNSTNRFGLISKLWISTPQFIPEVVALGAWLAGFVTLCVLMCVVGCKDKTRAQKRDGNTMRKKQTRCLFAFYLAMISAVCLVTYFGATSIILDGSFKTQERLNELSCALDQGRSGLMNGDGFYKCSQSRTGTDRFEGLSSIESFFNSSILSSIDNEVNMIKESITLPMRTLATEIEKTSSNIRIFNNRINLYQHFYLGIADSEVFQAAGGSSLKMLADSFDEKFNASEYPVYQDLKTNLPGLQDDMVSWVNILNDVLDVTSDFVSKEISLILRLIGGIALLPPILSCVTSLLTIMVLMYMNIRKVSRKPLGKKPRRWLTTLSVILGILTFWFLLLTIVMLFFLQMELSVCSIAKEELVDKSHPGHPAVRQMFEDQGKGSLYDVLQKCFKHEGTVGEVVSLEKNYTTMLDTLAADVGNDVSQIIKKSSLDIETLQTQINTIQNLVLPTVESVGTGTHAGYLLLTTMLISDVDVPVNNLPEAYVDFLKSVKAIGPADTTVTLKGLKGFQDQFNSLTGQNWCISKPLCSAGQTLVDPATDTRKTLVGSDKAQDDNLLVFADIFLNKVRLLEDIDLPCGPSRCTLQEAVLTDPRTAYYPMWLNFHVSELRKVADPDVVGQATALGVTNMPTLRFLLDKVLYTLAPCRYANRYALSSVQTSCSNLLKPATKISLGCIIFAAQVAVMSISLFVVRASLR